MKKAREDRAKVRDSRLSLKLTNDEKTALEKAADDRGLTMSSLARMVISDYLKING